MTNEEQKAVRSIAPVDDHRDTVAVFDPDLRMQLTNHYAGLAMQSKIRNVGQYGDFRAGAADLCVSDAVELVNALERHYSLLASRGQGNG